MKNKTYKYIREIVTVRNVAGSVVVSLPAIVRDPLSLSAGDRVMVEALPEEGYLRISKE